MNYFLLLELSQNISEQLQLYQKKIENLKHSKLFSTFQNDSEHFEIISNICKHQ